MAEDAAQLTGRSESIGFLNESQCSRRTRLILGSASPRRASLLRQIGADFEIVSADVDETVGCPITPAECVSALSHRKAAAVLDIIRRNAIIREIYGRVIVIGADTIVVTESGEILGKPDGAEDARRMLGLLAGKWHEVYTGVTLGVSGITGSGPDGGGSDIAAGGSNTCAEPDGGVSGITGSRPDGGVSGITGSRLDGGVSGITGTGPDGGVSDIAAGGINTCAEPDGGVSGIAAGGIVSPASGICEAYIVPSRYERTRVKMCAMDDAAIWRYIRTGEPEGKAGAYAIQGVGSLFIERVEGCYYNIVGLPLRLLNDMLEALGYDLMQNIDTNAE